MFAGTTKAPMFLVSVGLIILPYPICEDVRNSLQSVGQKPTNKPGMQLCRDADNHLGSEEIPMGHKNSGGSQCFIA